MAWHGKTQFDEGHGITVFLAKAVSTMADRLSVSAAAIASAREREARFPFVILPKASAFSGALGRPLASSYRSRQAL
jgi:hypothetical protein